MTRLSRLRTTAVAVVTFAIAGACGGGGGTQSESLAADQTLRFGIANDLSQLDPAQVDAAVDITFLQEVFTGLYKFDKNLKIVPDGAKDMPDVSADGLTYTFHLRNDVQFSNGDKVTAKDWIFSWTRTLRLNGSYASNLYALKGGSDVADGKATTVAGLSAPDDYTLKAVLESPAAYWRSEEHTSELQSRLHLVCRLLLEKK